MRHRLLLDTHALLWWLLGDARLSAPAQAAVGDPEAEVLVSVVSVFEISTKHRLRKLPLPPALAVDLVNAVAAQGFDHLPLDARSASMAGRLPGHHRDPFDRLLVGQAITAGLALVSNEALFDGYGVRRLW